MVTPLLPCWVHQQACRRPARQLDIPRTPACAAALRVCADGGANRLFDELPRMLPGQPAEAVRAQYLPTVIKGDLDSIRPDVLQFYRQRGVDVVDLSGGLTCQVWLTCQVGAVHQGRVGAGHDDTRALGVMQGGCCAGWQVGAGPAGSWVLGMAAGGCWACWLCRDCRVVLCTGLVRQLGCAVGL